MAKHTALKKYHGFISHASEDKVPFVAKVAKA
jgi:hypothetical protein